MLALSLITYMIWSSPFYRFRIPQGGSDDSVNLKEIVFDVTGSAPPFKEPSEGLKEVLLEILKSDEFKIDSVLEFGAAKLKNIPFILKQGKKACAVEFEELTKNDFTKKNIKKCEKFGSDFQKVIFPSPFLQDDKRFDLGLLINVLPVMPVLAERLYVLDLLHQKINTGKYLLWVAQKEGPYKKIREDGRNDCGDGIWMGKNRHFKTFYKYHQIEDLDEIMALYGFKLIRRYSIPDDARLYQKTDHNLFSGIVTPDKIRTHIPEDATITDPQGSDLKIAKKSATIRKIIPNPKEFSIESLYQEKIRSISPGSENAELYHRTVSHAVARIFRGSLRNMDIKVNIDGGIKIIDTIFTNCADKGFFHNLRSKVECSYPIIEMKNISDDPGNSEFDQLNGRLNGNHGKFGILVCRKADDEEAVYKRCKTYLPNNYILFLTDKDIIELLNFSRDNSKDEISDFMDMKLKNLLF